MTFAPVWGIRLKLRAEGEKRWVEGNKLRVDGDKLWVEGNKLREEGEKRWEEGNKLREEGDKLWVEAIREVHGRINIEWKNWSEKNKTMNAISELEKFLNHEVKHDNRKKKIAKNKEAF